MFLCSSTQQALPCIPSDNFLPSKPCTCFWNHFPFVCLPLLVITHVNFIPPFFLGSFLRATLQAVILFGTAAMNVPIFETVTCHKKTSFPVSFPMILPFDRSRQIQCPAAPVANMSNSSILFSHNKTWLSSLHFFCCFHHGCISCIRTFSSKLRFCRSCHESACPIQAFFVAHCNFTATSPLFLRSIMFTSDGSARINNERNDLENTRTVPAGSLPCPRAS